MKNLLIYINPQKSFDKETETLVKIQIDNSLDLDWKTEDILLVTNFDYEYRGVKSLVVDDELYCDFYPPSSKVNVFIYLCEKGFIKDKELYWFHDFDAFQLHPITEDEINMGIEDMALTDYGRRPMWSIGSIFFKKGAEDIFKLMKEIMYKYKISGEPSLMALTENNKQWIRLLSFSRVSKSKPIPFDILGIEKVNKRVKKISISYNFQTWNIRPCYEMAIKPIRVVHFHPINKKPINPTNPKPDLLDFFLRGKNKIQVKLMPERIVKIFNSYGII